MDLAAKPVGPGIKIGIGAGFFLVWLGLCLLLHTSTRFFAEGGWGMWPILAAGMAFLLITAERVHFLFYRLRRDRRMLAATVRRHLLAGDVAAAVDACRRSDAPLANIVQAGLSELNRSDRDVQEAVDEAALYELPRIETRTGYLAMIGNIATLLGLLGTIIGLITSFAGVSLENKDDPRDQQRARAYVHLVPACQSLADGPLVECIKQNKASILARGISEAMHCTAFGLAVGILSLLAFSVLNGRTQHLLDDIADGTVRLVNLAVLHRSAMRTDGLTS
ncbi:MAG: MotA/TolQ/ExbB proton channel family protein [Proteobacteria bacterium]|jgi:biopolymer transport protein ExbB|nr:MotA/TolQ/ExbB proton channel family protein [Pseudomonadota bacterium]